MERPWLPPARVVPLPGRGEVVCRVHEGPVDAPSERPWVLLLHGWTASADLQWFTAYEELATSHRFVALDHRGHGRGIRDVEPFTLEDAADDAAAVVRALDLGPVIVVGYSMGGPISLLLTRRHPALVAAVVLAATSMEFSSHRHQRIGWLGLPLLETFFRSRVGARMGRTMMRRLVRAGSGLDRWVPWLVAETRRNDPRALREAGRAISRFDARAWVEGLAVPAVSVVTTEDRLVPPARQRALATALDADVVECRGDHLVGWEDPAAFSRAVSAAVSQASSQVSQGERLSPR
jgi:3-oxoadipate enol-lactonase